MERASYYLYQRKRTTGEPVYYVRFRRPDGSVGSRCIRTGETNRAKAERWVTRELAAGRLSPDRRPPSLRPEKNTFRAFAVPWWTKDCPYVNDRQDRGFTTSPTHLANRRHHLETYLLPQFGSVALADISPAMVQSWAVKLRKEGLSVATRNRIIGTLKVMTKWAWKHRLTEYDPCAVIQKYKEEPRERGILTLDELRALFAPAAFEGVWRKDLRHMGCNMLAAAGGLSLGECQALQIQHVHQGYIDVLHCWDDHYGLHPPKWNRVRLVPIPTRVEDTLQELTALGRWGEPEPDDVLFWGIDRKTPLTKTAILKGFKAALRLIGISEEARSRRNLVFHSHRHGFNTLLRGKVADEQLRRVTGHRTLAMTDNYDHPRAEDLADVAAAQETLFAVKEECEK